jgi:hypothetical protein
VKAATLSASKVNPQEVVDAVMDLIEMPAGERPLQSTVGINGVFWEVGTLSLLAP